MSGKNHIQNKKAAITTQRYQMYRRWNESKQMDRKLNYFSPMNIYLSIICLYLIVSLPLCYRQFYFFLICSVSVSLLFLFFCRSQTAMSFTNSDIFYCRTEKFRMEMKGSSSGCENIQTHKNSSSQMCLHIIAKITAKAAAIHFLDVVSVFCVITNIIIDLIVEIWRQMRQTVAKREEKKTRENVCMQ